MTKRIVTVWVLIQTTSSAAETSPTVPTIPTPQLFFLTKVKLRLHFVIDPVGCRIPSGTCYQRLTHRPATRVYLSRVHHPLHCNQTTACLPACLIYHYCPNRFIYRYNNNIRPNFGINSHRIQVRRVCYYWHIKKYPTNMVTPNNWQCQVKKSILVLNHHLSPMKTGNHR